MVKYCSFDKYSIYTHENSVLILIKEYMYIPVTSIILVLFALDNELIKIGQCDPTNQAGWFYYFLEASWLIVSPPVVLP
jgi:hypothetical protein